MKTAHNPVRPQRPALRSRALAAGWSTAFAALGTVLIGVLMLIICADIVGRNLMAPPCR
jgi:hypothetical protein